MLSIYYIIMRKKSIRNLILLSNIMKKNLKASAHIHGEYAAWVGESYG